MVSQSKGLGAAAVALIVPLLFWLLVIPNGGENPKNHVWVYLSCIAIAGACGWYLGKNLKFAAWFAFGGAVLATLLCFAF